MTDDLANQLRQRASKQFADDLIAAEGREARLKAALEKAVEFICKSKQYAIAIDDAHLYGKAVVTLAELQGKADE